MKTILTLIIVVWGFSLAGQNLDTVQEMQVEPAGVITLDSADFVLNYELKGKKPLLARITDDFELRTAPSCSSQKTGVVIPRDSIALIYKYFPEEKCWATQYNHHWGFVSDAKVFPVCARTVAANRYDQPPQLKSGIHPKYPKEARKKGVKGRVYIKVFIDKEGKAARTIVLKGYPELNQAAVEAVKEAKYEAARCNNKKVGVWVTLSLNFK